MSVLKIGIPKGSLEKATIELFDKSGWQIKLKSRNYFPEVDDPELSCSICRPQEMSRYVESGMLDAGITGKDWTMENDSDIEVIADLVYSKVSKRPTRWVIAVPGDSDIKTIEGGLQPQGATFAIAAARFNEYIVDSLVNGAVDALVRHGVAASDITLVKVPGCYELPLAAKRLAKSGNYSGVVALGTVIRGATPHFDYVAGQCAAGLNQVALETEVPVGFGVLTTETIEQAIERAGTKAGNKGADAALTVLEMVNVLKQLN